MITQSRFQISLTVNDILVKVV